MTVVPFSHTSTSTFKSDVTVLANYAKQPIGAADGGTLQLLGPSRRGRCCARSQHLPATERYPILLGVMLIAMTLALVTGCGSSGSVTPPVALAGSVQGGHGPVSGASVQLYVASSVGLGAVALPLLQKAVASDSNGNFSIPAEYSCPSASSAIYVVASGGSASSSAGENSALMLTAMLGPCSGLAALGSVSVNEVTTVGSVWPLAHYFTSPTNLGSASNDTTFLNAVSSIPEFINLAQGSSPGTPTSTSSFAENNKLYSLADVLAACVSSSGGKAGDGSPCGDLFSMASSSGGSAPTDTMTAAIQIAQNPDNNVAGIYDLVKGSAAFEPTVTAAPSDWTLPLSYAVATPSISPVTGTYTATQDVTISDATQGSTIYYTTNGTVPTSSSNVYTGPISIAVSSTVEAIAVLTGSSSGVASSTITITAGSSAPLPPAKLAFVQQPTSALTGATISPAVTVAVEDSNGNPVTSATNPVTLALVGGTGLGGTLTATPQNGAATFSNLTASTAGTYTLSASSPSLTSATSTSFTISTSTSTPPTAATGCVYNITSYGAVGNGSTDNTTAINNAFSAAAAASPKCSVEIPAGTFNHSNVLVMTGISVFGLGSASILQATTAASESIMLLGTNPSLSNLVLLGTGTTRNTSVNPSAIVVGYNAAGAQVATTGFTINNVYINGASNTGIYDLGGSNGTIENMTVTNTLADSITNVLGANNILEQNNLIYNSGDDGMSNNSYANDPGGETVNHITINQNTELLGHARGLEVSGGNTITFSNNYVDQNDGDADMFISSECSSYQTQTDNNITVTGNTFVRGGPNQGGLELWADCSSNTIENVTINNNNWYNTITFTAVQAAGAGLLSNIMIENSNAYINPVSFYSNSASGGSNTITQTNNKTFNTTSTLPPPPPSGTVPIFSLPSGTYTLPQTITLNEPTSSDTMTYCTTSGTSCTPTTAYGSSITISTPQTVCALGTNNSSEIAVPSAKVCATYTGGGSTAAAPTF
jgi:Chitobiase/beta-hexosaminidase C-terminal domain/Pectate lyase superfamily protein